MKNKTFFNWPVVFLGVIAIVGFCFTPAFAEDGVFDPMAGIQLEDNSVVLETAPDPDAIFDDNFGDGYQYAWVPSAAFTVNGSETIYTSGAYRYSASGSASMVAPLNLPSGAHLYAAQLFYYDSSSSYYAYVSFYRFQYYTGSQSLGYCYSSGSGTPGYSTCTIYPNHTIRNGDSLYQIYVYLSGGTSAVRFMGVRLIFRRQIRTGLSHPFTDIGGLGPIWRNSIAALYHAGITSGCSSTQYCPNSNVTRAEMAIFLAKALGLHWAYPY